MDDASQHPSLIEPGLAEPGLSEPGLAESGHPPLGHDVIDTAAVSTADSGLLAEGSTIPQAELDRMTDDLITALKTVFDPEIPVDIYELGLIYKVDVSDDRDVVVEMTLTAPGCPVAGDMPGWVQTAVETVPGVRGCVVDLTFEPPWDPSKMSDEARLQLNMF